MRQMIMKIQYTKNLGNAAKEGSPQENMSTPGSRKTSNNQPNITPQGARKRTTKQSSLKFVEERK